MRHSRSRAVLAGIAGGLVGTLAMNYAQRAWTLIADEEPPRSAAGKHDARDWQEREESRNANEITAQTIATTFGSGPLTREQLAVAAPLVHFGFGATLGAMYGFWVGADRGHSVARGLTFGAATWLAADELAMPLFGLSRPTSERSLEKHLQSFVAHLVFGVVADVGAAVARD